MPTPILPAYAAIDATLDGLDAAAEIPALWQRYNELRHTCGQSKAALAALRLELGRRLLDVHEHAVDERGFSAWLKFNDIPRSSAYRAIDAFGRTLQAKLGTTLPSEDAFTLGHTSITLNLTPEQEAIVRGALAQAQTPAEQDQLVQKIGEAFQRLALDLDVNLTLTNSPWRIN